MMPAWGRQHDRLIIGYIVEKGLDGFIEDAKRQEWVIRTLRHFGYEPDQPPTDFEDIYFYALIEYGVGKPAEVMRLFRHEVIHREFEKALRQSDFAGLKEEASAVLDWLVRLVLGPHTLRLREFAAAHPEIRMTTVICSSISSTNQQAGSRRVPWYSLP